jgi:hypothetical protein
MESWIRTATGRKFDPLNPKSEDICIEDIAAALGKQCRFSGHTKQFYSVAQHSVLASEQVQNNPELALSALLHDASEAYLVDIPSPLKKTPEFATYRELESRVMAVIWERFGLKFSWNSPEIKQIDARLCATEARDLMLGWKEFPSYSEWEKLGGAYAFRIGPWDPAISVDIFLDRWYQLFDLHENP